MPQKIHASTTARVRAYRARQQEAGVRRFEIRLNPETVQRIEMVRIARGGGSMTATIEDIIQGRFDTSLPLRDLFPETDDLFPETVDEDLFR